MDPHGGIRSCAQQSSKKLFQLNKSTSVCFHCRSYISATRVISPLSWFWLLVSYFLLYFVVIASSLCTSCSPVFPVFWFPSCVPILLLCLIFPTRWSDISPVCTALLPVSLHHHLIPLLVHFVFRAEW